MANNFHYLLLLLVAIMATNLNLISTTTSPSSSHSTPPPSLPSSYTDDSPSSPPPPKTKHSPPHNPTSITKLPPPPPQTQPPPSPPEDFQQKQLNNIVDALIGAGDFAGWANFISSTNPSSLPITATLFIPNNNAISHLPTPTATAAGINFDPFIIPYHIIPQRLSFQELLHFTTNTRLPTLLQSKFIVITNNTPSNFTIDDSHITHPDMYVTASISVHGISNILDYALYGDGYKNTTLHDGNITLPLAVAQPHSDAGDFSFGGGGGGGIGGGVGGSGGGGQRVYSAAWSSSRTDFSFLLFWLYLCFFCIIFDRV